MTLQFKFPNEQTNLLAVGDTVYKLKIVYDEASSSRNKALSVLPEITDEIEEAVRAIFLMFIDNKDLESVASYHFVFSSVRKVWKASWKFKFKCNGQPFRTHPDLLQITVTTKEKPSLIIVGKEKEPTEKVPSEVCSVEAPVIDLPVEETPSKCRKIIKKGRSKTQNRQVKRTAALRSKMRRNKNSHNIYGLVGSREQGHVNHPVTRSRARKACNGRSDQAVSSVDSEDTEFTDSEISSSGVGGLVQDSVRDRNNFNQNSPVKSAVHATRSSVQSQASSSRMSTQHQRKSCSGRPLFRKSRLDQFEVQEEELAEELKLQELAQPTQYTNNGTGFRTSSPRKQTQKRSSLGSALDLLITPIKRFITNQDSS